MGWIIGGVIFAILAFILWCLCRASSMSNEKDDELESLHNQVLAAIQNFTLDDFLYENEENGTEFIINNGIVTDFR